MGIERNSTSKIYDLVNGIIMVGIFQLAILNYSDLSDRIPIHFNLRGEIDGWGHKSSVLIMFLVLLLLNAGLYMIALYCEKKGRISMLVNSPGKEYVRDMREEDKISYIQTLCESIRGIMSSVNSIFLYMFFRIVRSAMEGRSYGGGFEPWIYIILIFVVTGVSVFYMIRLYNIAKPYKR